MSERKFKEKSKVLSLRVPESQIEGYRQRFKHIIKNKENIDNMEYTESALESIKEIDNFLKALKISLRKHGNLSTSQFNEILKSCDFSHNKRLLKLKIGGY